jgi:hypothetical protein
MVRIQFPFAALRIASTLRPSVANGCEKQQNHYQQKSHQKLC